MKMSSIICSLSMMVLFLTNISAVILEVKPFTMSLITLGISISTASLIYAGFLIQKEKK